MSGAGRPTPDQALSDLRSGALAGAARFTLPPGTGAFPRELFALADTLEELDISGNDLAELPADFARFTRLRTLFSSTNRFTRLPEVLGDCPRLDLVGFKSNRIAEVPAASLPAGLRWLILTDNRIARLPPSLARCGGLRKLALAGNRLSAVPEEVQACRKLELLRISANQLAGIPPWLAAMPRLSWLAYGGNPGIAPREAAALAEALPTVPWPALRLGAQLGAGASGVIVRATVEPLAGMEPAQSGAAAREVALKLFKAEVTSDGHPASELAASVGAGRHPNLITAEATLTGHPAGTPGLVLPLVGADFRTLAGPPSLESCTRDVYPAATAFTPESALRLARLVAAAAAHLHGRGVLHGDLYAHNLLHDGHGDCRLGDFGAATLYDRATEAVEPLDVRAYGCLLEEVVERMPAGPVAGRLAAVRDGCLVDDPRSRPRFTDLAHELAMG